MAHYNKSKEQQAKLQNYWISVYIGVSRYSEPILSRVREFAGGTLRQINLSHFQELDILHTDLYKSDL
jgi:hypothetical protein